MWARAKKSLESESGIDLTINEEKAEMFCLSLMLIWLFNRFYL